MGGLFSALASGARELKSEAATLSDFPWFMLNPATKSGATVNWRTALEVATVLACARVIGESLATPPLKIYMPRAAGGADLIDDHELAVLLGEQPNGWQTAFEFRETMGLHLALTNNAYAYKSRVGGRLHELIQFEPQRVVTTRLADLSLVYEVTGDDGRTVRLPAEDVWHVRGPSWNGWMGLEAVRLAREAIGLSIELEAAHARLHKNGVAPGGVYSVEGSLTEPQHKQLTEWLRKHAGGENRGAPLVLDRGAKWVSQQLSGVDAQHLETRRFQIEEICRAMRVMPIMIGYSDKTATYASAEAMFQAHEAYTQQPWCTRLEQSIRVHLLSPADRAARVYARHNLSARLRSSAKDRGEYFKAALGAGGGPAWMTQDEVRALDELNPMGGKAAELREPSNVAKTQPTEDPKDPPPEPEDA